MEKVKERLAVLKMSDEERAEYYNYLKEAVHSQDVLTAAEQKGEKRGIEKGIEKGRSEKKLVNAQKMLQEGIDKVIISKITGLSLSEIDSIK